MNAEDRQAIRKKHVPCTCGACYDEGPECVWCAEMDWPCDVIKVLDALEQSQPAETIRSEPPVTECDHLDGGEIPHDTEGIVVWLYFTYCPKCGEKL